MCDKGNLVELVLSSHLYVGSRDQTQVTKLSWQEPLPTKSFPWPPIGILKTIQTKVCLGRNDGKLRNGKYLESYYLGS